MLCPIVKLAKSLIAIPSVSPKDLGCHKIISNRLSSIGFGIQHINIEDTSNLYAVYGNSGKTIAFLGHSDVVPSGNIRDWRFPPFQPIIYKGLLFGRGSADMKGSIAAMIIAVERFISIYRKNSFRFMFIITSDEESKAINGTVKVVEYLISKKEKINYCIVGEPTSMNKVGDTVKNGRRGSLTVNLTIYGIQGHIAYPELANNPIHNVLPFLLSIVSKEWSKKDIFFSKTSVQISQIKSGLEVNNMIPGSLFVQFNFRFGTNITESTIQSEVCKLLHFYKLKYSIKWISSAQPFITNSGTLLSTVSDVVYYFNKFKPSLSTDGGTSDGRFLVKIGAQIIELGPVNKTIHKVNECVSIYDLQLLSKMYFEIIRRLALSS